MSDLSIEQAALAAARKDARDWKGHAEREVTAILVETMPLHSANELRYDTLVTLMAVAWLQGVNYGAHDTLEQAERAFDRMRDEL